MANGVRWQSILVAVVCLAAALTTLLAPVRYTKGDASGTLLVSEQIIRNGSISLDAYDRNFLDSHYTFYERDGRTYDGYPIGTAIVALPLVGLAIVTGIDVFEANPKLQITLAALIAALLVFLLYALARMYLPFATSLLMAAAAWWGTSLASTGGTALWSHNLAIAFGLCALIVLARMTEWDRWNLWPWLSLSLFAAYLCRPTLAFLAPFALGYVLLRRPRTGLRTAALLAALVGAFMVMSLSLYDAWLPPYYWGERGGERRFLEALAGHVASPSRGLLVFTPVLVLIPLLALITPTQARRRAGLLVVVLGWVVVHWIVVSRHPQWYGGHSYGPRLMVDVLPGLFFAVVLLWPPSYARWPARAVVIVAAILAVAGVWIHTAQGLYNRQTLLWNLVPRVEDYPEKVLDWRYPQFLHSEEREAQRRIDYGLPPD